MLYGMIRNMSFVPAIESNTEGSDEVLAFSEPFTLDKMLIKDE